MGHLSCATATASASTVTVGSGAHPPVERVWVCTSGEGVRG